MNTLDEIRARNLSYWREYEAFIASMVEHCHCEPESLRPCDGVLSGGVCDGVKEEPKEPEDDVEDLWLDEW